jgi:hypothetical protein
LVEERAGVQCPGPHFGFNFLSPDKSLKSEA